MEKRTMFEEGIKAVKLPKTVPVGAKRAEEKRSVYTYNQVLSKAIEYFKGDELAANVWINKYALKDSKGNIYELTPDDMHRRLAREFARIEEKYPNPLRESTIYELLKDFKYIVPQGGPMA